MRRSSKDPLNLGNVKMHARFEALDVVGFVAGVRYALSQIESGKSAVTIASDPKPKKRETK